MLIVKQSEKDHPVLRHRFRYFIILIQGLLLLCFLPLLSCCKHDVPAEKNRQVNIRSRNETKKVALRFLSPENNQKVYYGDKLEFEVHIDDTIHAGDSLLVRLDNTVTGKQPATRSAGEMVLTNITMGTHSLQAELYRNGQRVGSHAVTIEVFPEYAPKRFTYRIINTYSHDPTAYTQGLVYENGMMYESTGLRGESSLRKWVPETGKLISSLNLPPDLFGEGCALLGNEIYQLTWTSRVGFVYDKESFSVKKRVTYATQGWGLTTDGKRLIMSDGSNNLYFLDPEYFKVMDHIEVYDHNGPVSQLNELELINGEIWANVYMTDDIVIIDPATGRVTGRINLKGLLPNKDYGKDTDVLNGIAWDPDHKRIFLTGKKWPKLFEIRLVPQ